MGAAQVEGRYRRSRGEQVGLFLRGDWWRIAILGFFLVGAIAPLVMAFLISLKTIPQFARQPFALTFRCTGKTMGWRSRLCGSLSLTASLSAAPL